MAETSPMERPPSPPTIIDKTIRFCIENKLSSSSSCCSPSAGG